MRSLQTLCGATRAPLVEVVAVMAAMCALAAAPQALADTPARPSGTGSSQNTAAKDPAAAPSMRVSYQDLNLTTPEGIAALYLRIRHAALQVCESTRVSTGTRIESNFDRCVLGAVAATVKQIGSPGLAALELDQRVLGDAGGGARNLCDPPPGRAKLII